MVYRLRHPFSGHIYAAIGDGLVEVDKAGKRGVFDRYGCWQSGEVRSADVEMCRWLGTHENAVTSRHAAGFTEERDGEAAVEADPSSHTKEGEAL
ncbi:hypothetical protein [Pseudonocardia acidicola]|uniref:Transposase n=1 Tax=Pseudonocardia acidicola TaxID=2724939 RepID=A0ABX1SCH1_9PSEU|nr:hypothetical protein [Pseudonocardia acidicola]NMH98232.1 hypothetical protein [Pseudonocardia acidicola]